MDDQESPLLPGEGDESVPTYTNMDDPESPLLPGDGDRSVPTYTSPNPPPVDLCSPCGSPPQVVIESDTVIKVYGRRWYILLVFSLFAGTQSGVWNTWGPLSTSAQEVFGWGAADISLLTNWGPISYLACAAFFSWLIETKGLRWACLSSMFLIALGCGLRCITSSLPAVTWTVNVGQCLVGAAGPVAMAAPPVLSAVWFPPTERTTCTAIAYGLTMLLLGMGFIVGPLLVPQGTNGTCSHNHTHHKNLTDFELYEIPETTQFWEDNNCTNSSGNIEEERNGIMFYMYVEFGWSLAVLFLMVVYFPSQPPSPPCVTAALAREQFWPGFKKLLRNGQFWLVAVVYGVALGVVNCWSSVLDVNLAPLGVGETEAGWIGFYATCSGCIASIGVARCADIFSKKLKWFIISLFTISCVYLTWFALACDGIVYSSTAILYVTVIVGMTTANAAVPLIFELGCELTYPVGEGTTNGVLTTINNLGGLVFLLVLMIPNIHTMWMNWTVLGAVGVSIPLMLFLRESYVRFNIDISNPSLHERKILQ